jgi:uncharacterized SAM-binding protein YcdF (DUF218 family)
MFVTLKRLLVRGALIAAPLLLILAIAVPRAGAWLVVQDPLEKSDAIFVLGGTMFERPLEAVDLYHEGWAPRILLFRQIADKGEAELIRRGVPYPREVDTQITVMEQLGVPRSAIVVLDPADSTAAEAGYLREAALRNRYTRLIVVTSKQHTRRARLAMARRLDPAGIKVIIRYSRYDLADAEHWWRERETLRFTLFEWQRLLGYWTGIAD